MQSVAIGAPSSAFNPRQKGIRWMRLSHVRSAIRVRFDDPNLVSCAGLVHGVGPGRPLRPDPSAG